MENWAELPALIQKDFDLPDLMNGLYNQSDFAQFRLALIQAIKNILQKSPEKLAQIMYRIDIDEHKFRQALAYNQVEILADLVIEREMQKIITRLKYK
jgi:hypothetical protein